MVEWINTPKFITSFKILAQQWRSKGEDGLITRQILLFQKIQAVPSITEMKSSIQS